MNRYARVAVYLIALLLAAGLAFNLLYAQHEATQRTEANRALIEQLARLQRDTFVTSCRRQNENRTANREVWSRIGASIAASVSQTPVQKRAALDFINKQILPQFADKSCTYPPKPTRTTEAFP